ncbi:MAG: response regulator, partial [Lachnospiraceae bacterium]|nr:response regulator [Lachnospiraceae bacterium]
HYVFRRDDEKRFGKSTVVWIALLFMIFFVTMLWFREQTQSTSRQVLESLNEYNVTEMAEHGIILNETEQADVEYYLAKQIETVDRSMQDNGVIQLVIILTSLFIMFSIYNAMKNRQGALEVEKVAAEQSNKAKSIFLSNMSHDIRTPMNAIIGYTELCKDIPDMPAEGVDYLNKIEASSQHLLALINDVLDMSRIESGKMELDVKRADLVRVFGDVKDLFATQMEMKGLSWSVDVTDVTHRYVICDENRLNRVLLNLISNAYKFTPEGGSVAVTVKEEAAEEHVADFAISVKDTGLGMSPEFAKTVFEAYSRERNTAESIQGTGLGMAITKSMVDLMGGTIEVKSEQGKGTEFIIHVRFGIAEAPEKTADKGGLAAARTIDYKDMKLLLVEDQMINREIATRILTKFGFALDYAENGQLAVEKVAASAPGEFAAVLMDIQMPVMNGYEAARAIRALDDEAKASVPIIAMTANAFAEDVQAAKDAGMNSHIAKPINIDKMIETLSEVL